MTNNIPENIQHGINQAARGEGKLIDTDKLPTDQDDVTFAEALDALMDAVYTQTLTRHENDRLARSAAEARVLALYAERQGEVYEVMEDRSGGDEGDNEIPEHEQGVMLIHLGDNYRHGQRVRVAKVEEGT